MTPRFDWTSRMLVAAAVALVATGVAFRAIALSSMPGISGDEGWWGVQAQAWLAGRPYEARTTSGNPIDLFFLVPVAVLHAVWSPSFGLLRAVPVLANLLALPIGFWFVRRLYGSTAAWIHTVALAVLPTAIAHSRITQDPSQTIFWTGPVVYLSVLALQAGRNPWPALGGALAVFAVALWTHPTNVFLAPFLGLPIAAAAGPWLPASRRGRALAAAAAAILVTVVAIAAIAGVRHAAGSYPTLDRPWLSIGAARLIDGRQWFEFAANNARLLNGVTVYHYFSGARPWTPPYDAAAVAVVAAALWGWWIAARAGAPRDWAPLVACAVTWLGFFVVAGPEALRPHAERWGLCLIVPAVLVVSRGLAVLADQRPPWRAPLLGALVLAAAGLLASFEVHYFRAFATTGGRSHLTYVTAPIEPKRQALDRILAASAGTDRVTIAASQWWLRWPIAYLATAHSHVIVKPGLPGDADAAPVGPGDRLFVVEFSGTPELEAATAWIARHRLRASATAIQDAAGRDLIAIVEVAPAP